jgi:hypothetical protein
MSRGLRTLHYKRHLLNPFRHGQFAWMLLSHKLARWLVPWAALLGLAGVILLAADVPVLALPLALGAGLTLGATLLTWLRPRSALPRAFAVLGYVVWGIIAGLHAWLSALRGNLTPIWEPTRREIA